MEETVYHQIYQSEKNHWWFCARRTIIKKVLNKLIGHASHKKNTAKKSNLDILEVGCGTGGNYEILAGYGNLYGLEMSDDAINYAHKNNFTNAQKGQLPHQIPFKKKFDIICAFDVIEHIEEDSESLTALHSYLKEDGYFIILVPAWKWLWSRHDVSHHHKRRYSKKSLLNIVDKQQYLVKYITYLQFFLFPLLVIERGIVSKLFDFIRKNKSNQDVSSNWLRFPFINSLFKAIFSWERHFILNVGFPWGSSILCVLQKK